MLQWAQNDIVLSKKNFPTELVWLRPDSRVYHEFTTSAPSLIKKKQVYFQFHLQGPSKFVRVYELTLKFDIHVSMPKTLGMQFLILFNQKNGSMVHLVNFEVFNC